MKIIQSNETTQTNKKKQLKTMDNHKDKSTPHGQPSTMT